MVITEKDVKYILNLARINASDTEITEFSEQLEGILNHVDKLNELDIKSVAPYCYKTDDSFKTTRKDDVKKSFTNKEILSNAPSGENGFFKVKKVIE
jgi:aspartyl-tRNA(Asn)/glutamyl-tRNA(Gln) amidotransferase subunit C